MANNKLGSARQFFEKALKNLKDQDPEDEYIKLKTTEVYNQLQDISKSLSVERQDQDAPKTEESIGDLDLLFNDTKKKW